MSSLAPCSTTVSPIAPRSMVVFAPISTSSPMRTLPTCGTLTQVPAVRRKAEAVRADDRAGVQQHRSPEHHAGIQIDPRHQPRIGADPRSPLNDAPGADRRLARRSRRPPRSPPAAPRSADAATRARGDTTAVGCTPGALWARGSSRLGDPRVAQDRGSESISAATGQLVGIGSRQDTRRPRASTRRLLRYREFARKLNVPGVACDKVATCDTRTSGSPRNSRPNRTANSPRLKSPCT